LLYKVVSGLKQKIYTVNFEHYIFETSYKNIILFDQALITCISILYFRKEW